MLIPKKALIDLGDILRENEALSISKLAPKPSGPYGFSKNLHRGPRNSKMGLQKKASQPPRAAKESRTAKKTIPPEKLRS